ncbi:MAG TPA: SMC family ATPase [Ktedonobacteraceae bacterium]|nr:SMC family ATPase [Ktedonobacteraceae bacterium]
MIPLGLTLENFMCYREETKIDFRGSPIWALSGHNGAGKSTIFDAMRYALYGEHRAGKQNVEELIHRGAVKASSFTIAFDFAVGENEYRVRRTYSRGKRGTMEAIYLAGPDAPVPGRPGPQHIPGTENKDGFEQWVLNTIGLNEQAFTVSVLLLQGQSDKLLKLGSPKRHEVLTHIINLKRYDDLAKRAAEKQKEQNQNAKVYRGQLDSLELVDEVSMTSLEEKMHVAQEKKEQARQHQLHLTAVHGQARRWQQAQEEEKLLCLELKSIEDLLAQAEQIERDVNRLTTLQQIIQPMLQLQKRQEESVDLHQQIQQRHAQIAAIEAHIQSLRDERQEVQAQLETTHIHHREQVREREAIQKRLFDLLIPCSEIDQLQKKQREAQALSESLAAFDPTLDQQKQDLIAELGEIDGIEMAVPLLTHFAQYRQEWQRASQELEQVTQELHAQEATKEQIVVQLQSLREAHKATSEQVGLLQSELASQQALFGERQRRFDRFHLIEGGATCDYCGQPLTPEHLNTERLHVQQELQQQKDLVQNCQARYDEAQKHLQMIEQEINQCQKEELRYQQICGGLITKQNTNERQRDTAIDRATTQLELLSPAYLARIQGSENAQLDISLCLGVSYPTSEDLAELAVRTQSKNSLQRTLQKVEQDLAKREEYQQEQKHILRELESQLQLYPPERVSSLLEEQAQVQQRDKKTSTALQELTDKVNEQEQRSTQLTEAEQKDKEALHQLEQMQVAATTKLGDAKRTVEDIQGQLPSAWHVYIPHLSVELLATWQQEIQELQEAPEQYKRLLEARRDQVQQKQALAKLKSEQDQFLPEARCRPELVQEGINLANETYQEFDRLEQCNRADLQRLQGIIEGRQQLQQQWAEATRLAGHYKELAVLLGRDGLQRYLLQNAEAGIVYYANETLDSISGGTLRLELCSDSGGKAKALDMLAYNSAINASEPQSIELLSTSQQFRVAISLAIGIGRYMSNTSHRIESVIIDEGFGSLDAGSRDEMVQALQALEENFKRVIVVSHQNEFFDKFPYRYEMALVNGRSTIKLV